MGCRRLGGRPAGPPAGEGAGVTAGEAPAPQFSIPREVERRLVVRGAGHPLRALVVRDVPLVVVFSQVRANFFHDISSDQNCAASVDPSSAVVDDSPLLITFATSSK